MEQKILNELKKRFKKLKIDMDDYHTLIIRNGAYFNSSKVSGFTKSKDERFVCIPVEVESEYAENGYTHEPHCFEIFNEYTTMTQSGDYLVTTMVILLEKGGT